MPCNPLCVHAAAVWRDGFRHDLRAHTLGILDWGSLAGVCQFGRVLAGVEKEDFIMEIHQGTFVEEEQP